MPVVTVYQHGQCSGTAPMRNDHVRAKREDVTGWTAKSARSNTRFLQSVSLDSLTGAGFAFTLTIRDCPENHDAWQKLRKAYTMRLQRAGMIRLHWVTEWQRRGVPHLHGVVYFPETISNPVAAIEGNWLDLASKYTAAPWSQNSKPITDSLGWLQYLAKHAARGAGHYQRSSENRPASWNKTGRIWGKWGEWDTREPLRFDLEKSGNFAYRRLIRGYRRAAARDTGNGLTIRSARRMLKCNNRSLSEVRGTSGWIPEGLTLAMLSHVAAQGHSVSN